MRIIPLLAAAACAIGLSATPAAADTRLATATKSVGVPAARAETVNPFADQYRERRWRNDRWRDNRGNRGWHGNKRWNDRYRYRGNGWRYGNRYRSRVVCRTSWRYGRPYRVCWRR